MFLLDSILDMFASSVQYLLEKVIQWYSLQQSSGSKKMPSDPGPYYNIDKPIISNIGQIPNTVT